MDTIERPIYQGVYTEGETIRILYGARIGCPICSYSRMIVKGGNQGIHDIDVERLNIHGIPIALHQSVLCQCLSCKENLIVEFEYGTISIHSPSALYEASLEAVQVNMVEGLGFE